MSNAGLIVIAGLPGTGKTSIAIPLARRLRAPYLRVDTIEQALVASEELAGGPGVAGYQVAAAVAGEQLRVGLCVIVECVNPLKITRDAWRATADQNGGWILEVETICSDADMHRARVENRTVDVPGLMLPDWQQVLDRDYETWDRAHLILDTSRLRVEESVATIVRQLDASVRQTLGRRDRFP